MVQEMNGDTALAEFQRVRPRLFGIAYRMLGTASEAEDIVQEAWLRWQRTDRDAVREPPAFLATVVTRLAINELESARSRRETYVGPWLPEPVSTATDPALGAERAEALEFAVVLLLERLTPAERAAYVLHEAFDYPFKQVAEVLEISEANARQLASRARTHLARDRGTRASADERARLLDAFLSAAQAGDLSRLEALLAEGVVSLTDGGGFVTAARKPVTGRARVAMFVLGVLDKFGAGLITVPTVVNGQTAVLALRDATPIALWTIDVAPDGIDRLLIVMNPEKLARFGPAPVG